MEIINYLLFVLIFFKSYFHNLYENFFYHHFHNLYENFFYHRLFIILMLFSKLNFGIFNCLNYFFKYLNYSLIFTYFYSSIFWKQSNHLTIEQQKYKKIFFNPIWNSKMEFYLFVFHFLQKYLFKNYFILETIIQIKIFIFSFFQVYHFFNFSS